MAGVICTVGYALNRGPDTNFDLRNIRAFNAWMIVRGRLGDDPRSNLLTQYLPLHDIANVVLIGTGHWWLPVVFWTVVHVTTVLVCYRLIGVLSPTAPESVRQLVAVVSLASPLIMMEIGTSFGDLTVAPFFGLMLLTCLKKTSQWNWWAAGAFLALGAVMKPTVLLGVPAILIGVALLAYSVVQVATFGLGFVGFYFPLCLAWSAYWSHTSGTTFLSVPGLPVSGSKFVIVTLTALALLLATALPPIARHFSVVDRTTSRRAFMWTLRPLLVGAMVYLGYKWNRQFQISGDTDWLVRNVSEFVRRFFHTGSLSDGYRPLDLEMPYHDFRVPMATVALGVGIVTAASGFRRANHEKSRSIVGSTIVVVIPIFFMIWTLGYARYFIQFLPFVPIVLLANVNHFFESRRRPSRSLTRIAAMTAVLVFAVAALIPVGGGSPFVKRFAQTSSEGNLLSEREAKTLNALIPRNVTVHVAGILVSSAAVILNREDVKWTYEIPSTQALQSRRHVVLYSPQWQKAMIGLRQSGAETSNCVVLRFTHVIYGVCDLSA